jgi:DNA-directed RNA polymerase I, II, and III subunit RPABC2
MSSKLNNKLTNKNNNYSNELSEIKRVIKKKTQESANTEITENDEKEEVDTQYIEYNDEDGYDIDPEEIVNRSTELDAKEKTKGGDESDNEPELSEEESNALVEEKQDGSLEEKQDGSLEEQDNIPYLEVVSDAIKEKYEYKPLLRTEIVYVLPEDRITSEVLTKFEYCEVISIRAKQIENGASSFTDVGDLTDPIEIAKKEIADKKCPLDIVRMKTDKIAERWHVNEMAIPFD